MLQISAASCTFISPDLWLPNSRDNVKLSTSWCSVESSSDPDKIRNASELEQRLIEVWHRLLLQQTDICRLTLMKLLVNNNIEETSALSLHGSVTKGRLRGGGGGGRRRRRRCGGGAKSQPPQSFHLIQLSRIFFASAPWLKRRFISCISLPLTSAFCDVWVTW